MEDIAVITGDIIDSTMIPLEKREFIFNELKGCFLEINEKLLKDDKNPFEIYRGDSFQAVIVKPELSLLVGILIRSKLRSLTFGTKTETRRQFINNCDARISIGIGTLDYRGAQIIESDGKAFQYSGRLIESMKRTGSNLSMQTPWDNINEEMNVSLAFTSYVISRWTQKQAETIYQYLLNNESQTELATKLKVSQPMIHRRLDMGQIDTIELLLNRFQRIIIKTQ